MEISVKASKLPEGSSEGHLKGLANINFGDQIKVRSVQILEGKDGQLFVAMPSYKTNRTDEQGKAVFNEICNPINADFRAQLYAAVIESFESGNAVKIDDGKDMKMSVIANAMEEPKGGVLGNAKVYINDNFVITGIAIREGKNGHAFPTMPSFKTSKTDEQGKAVYQEVAYAANDTARRNLNEAVMQKFEESRQVQLEAPDVGNPFLDDVSKEDARQEVAPKEEKKAKEPKAKATKEKAQKEEKGSIADSMKAGKEKMQAQPAKVEPDKAKGKDAR